MLYRSKDGPALKYTAVFGNSLSKYRKGLVEGRRGSEEKGELDFMCIASAPKQIPHIYSSKCDFPKTGAIYYNFYYRLANCCATLLASDTLSYFKVVENDDLSFRTGLVALLHDNGLRLISKKLIAMDLEGQEDLKRQKISHVIDNPENMRTQPDPDSEKESRRRYNPYYEKKTLRDIFWERGISGPVRGEKDEKVHLPAFRDELLVAIAVLVDRFDKGWKEISR